MSRKGTETAERHNKRRSVVRFEIVRCANESSCGERPLVLVSTGGAVTRLTGRCKGPYELVAAYLVERDRLLAALGDEA